MGKVKKNSIKTPSKEKKSKDFVQKKIKPKAEKPLLFQSKKTTFKAKKNKNLEKKDDKKKLKNVANNLKAEEKIDKSLEKVNKAFKKQKVKTQLSGNDNEEELVSRPKVLEMVLNLKKITEQKENEKKSIFDPNFNFNIEICSFKIPKCPKRLAKMLLPHSLIHETDDICLFVKDLERGRKRDYQQSIDYFEELLKKNGVTNIKTVMPLNQLLTDYQPYELKIKLCNSYDRFLTDARISGRIFKALGKNFISRKKMPTAVILEHKKKDLKTELEKALLKVTYKQVNTGNRTCIDIGTHRMDVENITDNIMAAIQNLKKQLPGGWQNIKNIYLKSIITKDTPLPLYVNLSSGNDVPVPLIIGPKETKLKKKQELLNKSLKKFQVTGKAVITEVKDNEFKKKLKVKQKLKTEQQKAKHTENVNVKPKKNANNNDKNNEKHLDDIDDDDDVIVADHDDDDDGNDNEKELMVETSQFLQKLKKGEFADDDFGKAKSNAQKKKKKVNKNKENATIEVPKKKKNKIMKKNKGKEAPQQVSKLIVKKKKKAQV